jgi:hypothetical protein
MQVILNSGYEQNSNPSLGQRHSASRQQRIARKLLSRHCGYRDTRKFCVWRWWRFRSQFPWYPEA